MNDEIEKLRWKLFITTQTYSLFKRILQRILKALNSTYANYRVNTYIFLLLRVYNLHFFSYKLTAIQNISEAFFSKYFSTCPFYLSYTVNTKVFLIYVLVNSEMFLALRGHSLTVRMWPAKAGQISNKVLRFLDIICERTRSINEELILNFDS